MALKQLSLILLAGLILSCNNGHHVTKVEGKRIEINPEIPADSAIEAFIKPYHDHLNKDLDSIISYAPMTYAKTDGELNTAIGNLMADAVYSQCNPLFKKRTGKDIDFVLLNYGGIRSVIPQGNITTRTAYEIMPFENAVVVTELKGAQIQDLLRYLSIAKRAHPISQQLQITLNERYEVISATLNGSAIAPDKSYFVATNDYLFNGGDKMSFFQQNEGVYPLNYKVRNVLIDYFKKIDTLKSKKDNRFIRVAP
jgi:2',3'-cyclic-nucleotide 2'-phosphodiesterase (5'-nucleotidase family)